jgi:hypothetical protein
MALPSRRARTPTVPEETVRSAERRIERAAREAERGDAYWPAQLAILGVLGLHLALPDKLLIGPRWLIPALEGALLLGLVVTTPRRHVYESRARRGAAMLLTGLVSAANTVALGLLVHYLLGGGRASGHSLILSAIDIWLTNVVVFGLWYWEMDRGGPGARLRAEQPPPDFLFPQMATSELGQPGWRPGFVDYLYVSFTNASAFSPTDTMPLTTRAKLLMLVQALASLITVALVAGRAVNILS